MGIKGDDRNALPGCSTGSYCNAHGIDHASPDDFDTVLYLATGKTWEELAKEHWERYQGMVKL